MSACNYFEKLRAGLPILTKKTALTDLTNCKDKAVYQKAVRGHHGCVNALGIGANEQLLASGGDDRRIFLWDIQDLLMDNQPMPKSVMDTEHYSNVFSTNFTPSGEKIISTGNDAQIIVHDVETGKKIIRYMTTVGTFYGNCAVYNSSVMPDTENIFVVCSDNPDVCAYDLRVPVEVRNWSFETDLFSVDFHPTGRFFALAGKRRLGVIDFRNGQDIYDCTLHHWLKPKGATHAKFSPTGSGLAVVRPYSVPIYFDFHENTVSYLTDPSGDYRSRFTVKSCDFIGEDTVVTGSEMFDIFMWKLTESREINGDEDWMQIDYASPHENYVGLEVETYTRLKGHRSIANLMKYSPKNGILFSSGVEKIIKMWSPYRFPGSTDIPNLRIPGVPWRSPYEIVDEESEDEEVLLHFDNMATEVGGLSPEDPFDDDAGFVVQMVSDSDSDSETRSSQETIPLRRMEIRSRADGTAEVVMISDDDDEEEEEEHVVGMA